MKVVTHPDTHHFFFEA